MGKGGTELFNNRNYLKFISGIKMYLDFNLSLSHLKTCKEGNTEVSQEEHSLIIFLMLYSAKTKRNKDKRSHRKKR